jgi:hypothetical protein
LEKEGVICRMLIKVKKEKLKAMFFLVYKDRIEPHDGELDKLPQKKLDGVEKALRARYCLQMKTAWVAEGKERKTPTVPFAGTERDCVVEDTNGSFRFDKLDVGKANLDVANIYLIDQVFVRKFVAVKIDLDKTTKSEKKPASTPRSRRAAKK